MEMETSLELHEDDLHESSNMSINSDLVNRNSLTRPIRLDSTSQNINVKSPFSLMFPQMGTNHTSDTSCISLSSKEKSFEIETISNEPAGKGGKPSNVFFVSVGMYITIHAVFIYQFGVRIIVN